MNPTWDLGFIIGSSVAGLVLIFALAALVIGIAALRSKEDYSDDGWLYHGTGLLTMLVTVGLYLPLTFPFWDTQYHVWRPVSGQVERIESRMIAQGKGMEQRFIVIIEGQPYAIDDTRAALLKPGDPVSLMCIKEFVWASTPGDACNWVSGGGR